MRIALHCLLILCSWTQAHSAIVFSLTKATPDPIQLGSTARFNVSISSNAGTITNLSDISFFIDADDPPINNFQLGTKTAGGQFISGTSNFFPSPQPGFPNFLLTFPTSYQVFTAASGAPGLTLDASPTLLATFTLSAAGARVGDYKIELISSLHYQAWFIRPGFNSIALNLNIRGGLSESPFWIQARPGHLAPILDFEKIKLGN